MTAGNDGLVNTKVHLVYTPLKLAKARVWPWVGSVDPETLTVVEMATQVLKVYLPNLVSVTHETSDPIFLEKDEDTRQSLVNGLNGSRIPQLMAEKLPWRQLASHPRECCVQIVDPLMTDILEDDPLEPEYFNFLFSTNITDDCWEYFESFQEYMAGGSYEPSDQNSHWVVSPYWFHGQEEMELMVSMLLYSTFAMLGLSACENKACIMNNCDGVEEARTNDTFVMPCPTCFRALQLRGAFNDGTAVLQGLKDLLESWPCSDSKRSQADRERLQNWLQPT
uniref:Uncharacterized protein n=1 Tax=Octactis speculum TaxID=3111310 RepID=A0A7S2BYJ2_9STRA|mmetsp:Transcript_28945/g.39397  ORF Transcript_28945/g.39397 Transcript_28945/m.39397 type:complete len:280 (+) Transcript_28945:3-842(+)